MERDMFAFSADESEDDVNVKGMIDVFKIYSKTLEPSG